MHVYMYTYIRVYRYVHMCNCIHIYMYIDMYVCVHVYIYTCISIYIYVYMYTYIHVYRYIYMCTRIHIYMYIDISIYHTHIHIHILKSQLATQFPIRKDYYTDFSECVPVAAEHGCGHTADTQACTAIYYQTAPGNLFLESLHCQLYK